MFKGNTATIVPYKPGEHHWYKFLYFVNPDGEEALLVSDHPIRQHKLMLAEYNRQNAVPLDEACMKGAGYRQGGEIEWHSLGYNFFTPSALKPRILELLNLPQ
ncbi:MAG: hypothetical protein PHS79_04310 [Patescibacteria group bacterium]|nr:hypothetical protein [Patescibacteria group bacterium]